METGGRGERKANSIIWRLERSGAGVYIWADKSNYSAKGMKSIEV